MTARASVDINFLPEILEQIFRYLNVQSLSRAAVVSRSWNELATRELGNRGPQRIFISTLNEDVYDCVKTKPLVTLLFVGSARISNKLYAINEKNTHSNVLAYYKKYFPGHLVALKSYIVMMDEQIITYDNKSELNFLSLLIPQYRDLKVRTANSQFWSRDKGKFIRNFLPEDSRMKATIILFTPGPNVNFEALALIQESMKQRQQKYSLWGIAACSAPFSTVNCQEVKDHEKEYKRKEKPNPIFAMSITGTSLESWSTIINCIARKDEFDRQILDFRERLRLKKRSIGLVCGPCDVLNLLGVEGLNSSNMYADYRELMSAIKKVFPDISFIGLYDATFACYYGMETKTTCGFYENVQNSMSVSLMILTYD